MNPFDIRDPLPTGTTILEASAGTGKTYTVGALVTRYVAEGLATLEQLLVVTFGRVASLELRERVRGQLVAAERGLADPAAARGGDDHLLALLAEPDDEVARRRRRIATALADFDAATIATTHQFCQQVLTGLGVAGDSEPGATLVESLDDLVVEVVDDLYVRGFARSDAGPAIFTRAEALELGRAAIGNPQARLEPAEAEPGSTPRASEGVRGGGPHRGRPPKAAATGCSATTTCSAGSPERCNPRTPRPGPGCGRGGRSCWSTSSRTPTRCSGRCWSERSPGTPRSC